MGRSSRTSGGAGRSLSTRSSRVPNLLISPSNSRRHSSWSSTLRPRRPSGSRSRRRCCCGPTRLSSDSVPPGPDFKLRHYPLPRSLTLEAGEAAEEALAVKLCHRLLVDEVPGRGKARNDAEPVEHPRGGGHALGGWVHRARHELGEVEVGGLENLAVRLAAVLPDHLDAELPVGAEAVHALRVGAHIAKDDVGP